MSTEAASPAAPSDSPATLLAELKGLPGTRLVESPDEGKYPQPPHQSLESQLIVPPLKDDRTAVRRADDKHSTLVGGKGFRMVVAGEYYAISTTGQGKIRKSYELAFNVPSLEGALSLIVSKLLNVAGKKAYADWVSFRTHDPVSAQPLSRDTPPTNSLQYMDRDRLERYVAEARVPVDPAQYPKLEHLREAVIDHKVNPAGFEKREARKQEERRQEAELMKLNPDLDPDKPRNTPPLDPAKDLFLS